MKTWLSLITVMCVATTLIPLSACQAKTERRTCYDLTFSYDEDKHLLTGRAQVDFYNDTDNSLTDLKFNLYGNAYRQDATLCPISKERESKAYYGGNRYGSMQVSEVVGCSGWTVGGTDQTLLCVNLVSPVYPEERVSVTISYTLTLADVNHRTGVTPHTVNLGNFYPVLCTYGEQGFVECPYYATGDPFLSACADYTVHANLPSAYTAVASGEQTDEKSVDNRTEHTYKLANARDFALVLCKDFSCLSAKKNGVTVNYYYYDDNSPQTAFNAACESFAYFDKTFGDYAYPTYSVVQTGFCYGGMEYPALSLISDSLASDDAVYTIVHETAHQWWYAMVGSDSLRCAWQDEGLAEYSALLFFENTPVYAFTRKALVNSATNSYRSYYSVYNQLFGKVDTSMNRSLPSFASEYEYINIAYNKGLLLFDTLRSAIGDQAFLEGLRTYWEGNKFAIATPLSLMQSFHASGTDLEGFFSSFLEGKIIL